MTRVVIAAPARAELENLILYEIDEGRELVTVVTIEDGRASTSPTRG